MALVCCVLPSREEEERPVGCSPIRAGIPPMWRWEGPHHKGILGSAHKTYVLELQLGEGPACDPAWVVGRAWGGAVVAERTGFVQV